MKHSSYSSLSALALLLGTFSLVGCGGAVNIDDSAPTTQVVGPPIQGSVYGGHAPIQGAHVYLLQPGTSGYGSAAVSLLGSGTTTSPGGYALAANSSDPNVPATAGYNGGEPQYVTTDANGAFNLTNAYVCTVNQPVYIYAYGGNIGTTSTNSQTTVTLNITSASETNTGGRNPTYTYTFNFTTTGTPATKLAVGDTVTLALTNDAASGRFGTAATGWNNLTSVTVATVNSTSNPTSFTATGTTATTNNNAGNGATGTGSYTYTTTGTQAPTQNDNIVQLAVLGNCPSSGNFSTGSTALSYVYLNEVSTVAAAYVFQPFTLATNNNAWDIGIPNPTANSGQHAQALVGIQNAASTAAELYNIQGSSTLISSSGDGEGHLANQLTINGNGIVPQATIDTLANILADCVDSVPTTVGTPTSQCSALFTTATDDGTTTGTQPTDTGTAAINIARYPAGNGSSANVSSTYVSSLFTLQGATVPYVPDLTAQPNDWTIAISYPVSSSISIFGGVSNPWAQLAESIAVDASGNVFVTGQTKGSIIRLDSQGVIYPATAQNYLGYIPGYVSVDGNGNAWTGNANCGPGNGNCSTGTAIFLAGGNGVFSTSYGSGYQKAYVDIADNAGDDYFFANVGNGNYEMYEYPAGAATNSTPNVYSLTTSGFGTADVAHGAIDASGDFWLTSETSPYVISRVTNTGTKVWSITTNTQQPEFVGIDASGNGWIPSQTAAGPIYKITSAGVSASLTSGTTGANLSYPFGSAIDGNGNAWITNRCGAYNVCTTGNNQYSSTLIEINGTNNQAISPSTNYLPETEYDGSTTMTPVMLDPLNVAIDPSGNLWITNYTGVAANGSVTEIVGAAAPVVTPLSAAAGKNLLGQKP